MSPLLSPDKVIPNQKYIILIAYKVFKKRKQDAARFIA